MLNLLFLITALIANCYSVAEKCSEDPLTWQNALCCQKKCAKGWTKLPLLLVSLDGFRADYLLRDKTPSIQSLINCGSHAPYIYSSFPTKTFPNHYTLVTGLYPESHGIVDNSMYDPSVKNVSERYYKPGNPNPRWWLGEPFWNTVTKLGMKAASYFWPGSDIAIQNIRQDYYFKYNESVPFYQRVDQVINWLLLNDSSRPNFISLYLHEPDYQGHYFGPASPEVTNVLIVVDAFINYLMRRIFENNLLQCVNIIVLADHGMQEIYKDYMQLTDYVETSNMVVYGGPVGRITLANSSLTVDGLMDKLMCKYKNAQVFKTENVPRRFHYSSSKSSKNVTSRIGDVVVIMDNGYLFSNSTSTNTDKGNHGFDYKTEAMHALFLAYGPIFKQNFTIKPFQNIELYNLYCDVLNIPFSARAKTNGTYGSLHAILNKVPAIPKVVEKAVDQCGFVGKALKQCGTCSDVKFSSYTSSKSSIAVPTTNNAIPLCQAQNLDHSVLYYQQGNLPFLFQFTVNSDSKLLTSKEQQQCTIGVNNDCKNFIGDDKLKRLNIAWYSLNSFEGGISKFLYGKVPMYDSFYSGPWSWLQNITLNYAKTFEKIVVINGIIFDGNSDGLADSLDLLKLNEIKVDKTTSLNLPTHFYQILLRCDGKWNSTISKCDGDQNVLSFILPHEQNLSSCLPREKYFNMHMSRVRDIEQLTGIQFFTSMDFATSVQLRIKITDTFW